MNKFADVELNDEIYSMIFGMGKVIFVLAKPLRLDGYYVFEVKYENGQRVHYTEDGRPSWCRDMKKCNRTICFKDEVDMCALDTNTHDIERLTLNRITQLKEHDELDMLSPAGGWVDANLMPDIMVDNAINNEEFHLFREKKKLD